MTRYMRYLFLLLVLAARATDADSLAATTSATAARSGESLVWQVISSGGTRSLSSSYRLLGTVVQTATGNVQLQNHTLHQGFWQQFAAPCAVGDADGSGSIDISDAVFLISFIFGGGPAPARSCEGDADGSGYIDVSDAVALIKYVFSL